MANYSRYIDSLIFCTRMKRLMQMFFFFLQFVYGQFVLRTGRWTVFENLPFCLLIIVHVITPIVVLMNALKGIQNGVDCFMALEGKTGIPDR